jgi:CheY-like chemotaxis protein
VPLRDAQGRPRGAISAMVYITARKEVEAKLMETHEELKAASHAKDEFLAMLGHELRNPLAPLRNWLEVLRLNPDRETLKRSLPQMDRQVAHMTRLVQDILDVSRITRGAFRLDSEVLNLRQILERAIEGCSLLSQRHHRFRVAYPDHILRVQGDPVRLTQIFVNLLDNAAKYTPELGNIWLGAREEGGEAQVIVHDDGFGIAPEELDRVFDPFTQLHSQVAGSYRGGLGIGLTLVRRLVELQGGTISIQSEGQDRGTRVEVRLPLAAAHDGDIPANVADPAAAASGRRVLVVEDDLDAAESLGTLLQLYGHRVQIASDGRTAVALAPAFNPEVVLLDIGLPERDGYDVARDLREILAHRPIFIALTGYAAETDHARSREAGFDLHLVKPVDPETLRALLADPVPNLPAPPLP